ncbi:MAG TPA: hypothetical protein VIY86_06110 [Pirellulaceae bacterium]
MSLGEAYPSMGMIMDETCGPDGLDGSYAGCGDDVLGYPGEEPVVGCAGSMCDGRCGGRCGIARRMRGKGQLKARLHNYMANRSLIGRKIRCTHNHCANGQCGGAVGPDYGAVHYPYYTTRGPRDFLMANPPSIGP